jgi:hypothetical protein
LLLEVEDAYLKTPNKVSKVSNMQQLIRNANG